MEKDFRGIKLDLRFKLEMLSSISAIAWIVTKARTQIHDQDLQRIGQNLERLERDVALAALVRAGLDPAKCDHRGDRGRV
jgi:hypothetical protein